jgi:hypothetical protein
MVEFLKDPSTGEFKLMEVNPRFWTSLPFTIQAGVDLPYYAWLLAGGRADEITQGYEVGIGGHLLRGELLFLHSLFTEETPLAERPAVGSSLANIGRSLASEPRLDNFSLSDPLPFLRDARNALGEIRANN